MGTLRNVTLETVEYLGAECQVHVFIRDRVIHATIVSTRYRGDLTNREREKIKSMAIDRWYMGDDDDTPGAENLHYLG